MVIDFEKRRLSTTPNVLVCKISAQRASVSYTGPLYVRTKRAIIIVRVRMHVARRYQRERWCMGGGEKGLGIRVKIIIRVYLYLYLPLKTNETFFTVIFGKFSFSLSNVNLGK